MLFYQLMYDSNNYVVHLIKQKDNSLTPKNLQNQN